MYHFSLNSHGSSLGAETSKRHARSIHSFQSHGDQLRTIALQRAANVSIQQANKQCLQIYTSFGTIPLLTLRSSYTPVFPERVTVSCVCATLKMFGARVGGLCETAETVGCAEEEQLYSPPGSPMACTVVPGEYIATTIQTGKLFITS